MASQYDRFPCPIAVEHRLGLLGEIEAALSTNPQEMAVDIGDNAEVLQVLTGRVTGSPDGAMPFGKTAVTIISIGDHTNALTQLQLHGPLNSRTDYQLRPDEETLNALTRRHATADGVASIMLGLTVFSHDLSLRSLGLIKARPSMLGENMALRMAAFREPSAEETPPSKPPENPRLLSRRRGRRLGSA